MYLSPYVEEPLNSKVIKSFVPELRSRYVFFEFRYSYVLSLWTFDVHFTRSRILLWYNSTSITSSSTSITSSIGITWYRVSFGFSVGPNLAVQEIAERGGNWILSTE